MTHNKFNNELQHFSIRKLTVGAASVLIGISFLAGNKANTVKADTVNDNSNNAKAVQEDNSADKEVANNYQADQTDKSASQSTVQAQDSVKTDTAKQNASGMTFDKSSSAVQKTIQNSAKQAPVQKQNVVQNNASIEAQASNSKAVSAPAESHVNAVEVKQNTVKAPEIKLSNVSSISESAKTLTRLRARHQPMIANVYAVVPAQQVDPNKIQDGETFHTNVGFKGNPMNTYLDYKDNGQLISDQKLSGNTGDTITFTPQLPDGYVATGSVPTTLKLTNGMDNTTVPVTHGTYHVNNGEGKNAGDRIPGTTGKTFASGVTNNDLNRTITRTITVNMPLAKYGNNQTINQTETWYRGADVDMVTGKVIKYTDWILKPGSASSMQAYNPTAIPGYTVHVSDPDQSGTTNTVNALNPSASSIDGWQQASHNANITYSANNQNVTFQFWDQDLNKEISHFDKQGVTDQTIQTGLTAPAHYDLVGSIPNTYTFGATNPVVKISFRHHINLHPDNNLPNVKPSDYQEEVVRTVTINVPDGNVTVDKNGNQTVASHPVTTPQKVTLTRTFSYDEVTQQVVSHGAWSTGTFAAVPVTVPAGYTVHVTGATLNSQGQIPSDTAKDGYVDPHINVTFTANAGKQTINYTDNTGHIIGTSVINGVVDQTVAVPKGMPTGWTTASSATVPSTVHIHATDNPITVGITHHITHFTHDTPIPDNGKTSTGKTINGGHAKDLAKTITRTVTIHQPSTYNDSGVLQPGDATPHVDSISYIRGGSYDDVTGNVTYDPWVKTAADAKKTLPAIDIPNHPGYTPSRTQAIPAQDPTNDEINNWTNPNISVTYSAQNKTQTIKFTDDKGNVLHTQVVPGKTDSVIDLKPEIPDGWVPTSNGEIPKHIIIHATDTPINYQVKHGEYVVSHDHPVNEGEIIPGTTAKKFPKGLTQTDLNLRTTRIISIHFPSTFEVPAYLASQMDDQGNIVQHITFWRDATIDTVTGQIKSYNGPLAGGWNADNGTGAFPAITIPDVPGYTAQITTDDSASVQAVAAATAVRKDGSIVSPQHITISLVRADGQNSAEKAPETDSNTSSVTAPADTEKASGTPEKANNATSESTGTPETVQPTVSENTPVKSDSSATDNTTPADSTAGSDSSATNDTKPADSTAGSDSGETDDTKPADSTAGSDSSETDDTTPADSTAGSDSSETDNTTPADSTAGSDSSETDNTKPADSTAKSDSGETDNTKPADSTAGSDSSETDNTKPADSTAGSDSSETDNTKPADSTANDSQKPTDSKSDSAKPTDTNKTDSDGSTSSSASSTSGQIIFDNSSKANDSSTAQKQNTDSAVSTPSTPAISNNANTSSSAQSSDDLTSANASNDSQNNNAGANTNIDSTRDHNNEPNNGSERITNNSNGVANKQTPAIVSNNDSASASGSNMNPEEVSYVSDDSDVAPLAQNAPASNVTVVPANTATILPQTGRQNAEVLAAIGVAASSLAILGLAGTRKRKNA